MAGVPIVSAEDARAMRAEYEGPQRMSARRIAEKWGYSASTVINALRRAGCTMRTWREAVPNRISDDDAQRMRVEYEADRTLTYEQMEVRWGWSSSAIMDAVKRVGGKSRPPGHIRQIVLDIPDEVLVAARDTGAGYDRLSRQFNVPAAHIQRTVERVRRAAAGQRP